MRIYDTRLGKFLSADPITSSYPSLTPYQFASNSPIKCIDLDGLEGDPVRGAIDWIHEQWQGLKSAERWNEAVANVNETINPFYIGADYGAKIITNKDLRGRPNDHRGRFGAFTDGLANGMMAWAFGRTLGSYGTNTLEAEINTFSSSARLTSKPTSSPSKLALQVVNEKKQEIIAFVKQESSSGKPNMATLGEKSNQQASQVFNIVQQGALPGSNGAYLGGSRLTQTQMQALTDLHKVEFAQVYTMGSGKKGGGGFYTLYSGSRNAVQVPYSANSILVDHTHPGGTTSPSIFDIQYLIRAQGAGSPQKSSVIIPSGGTPVRFNKTTPANGQE